MYLELLNEERCLFSVEINETGLNVLLRNIAQVLVNDLAPFEVLMIKVADHVLAAGHLGQELGLRDFCVRAVPLNHVFLSLLI